MCGRYASSSPPGDLVEEFDVEDDRSGDPGRSLLASQQQPAPGEADWNMAPTKQARVILTRSPRAETSDESVPADRPEPEQSPPVRQLRLLSWGLVPGWAKDVKIGQRMINARAESLLDKSSFRTAVHRRRAIVPADGWYEWQRSPTAKDAKGRPRRQPFFIRRADGAPLAFAGLYEFWRDPARERSDPAAWLASFCIITTAAEPGMDRIHDRQPAVLEPEQWAEWLDPQMQSGQHAVALLDRASPGRFEAWPVSTRVNGTVHNGPDLIAPAPLDSLHGVVDLQTGEILGGNE